jgi:hypothetical protein
MADASNLQCSFLGGEWSLSAQGRQDDPKYKTGMNVCFNAFPLEEGAWTRRPGFALAGFTDFGHKTYMFPFNFTEGAPYTVEVDSGPSANVCRIWSGTNHVFDSGFNVISIQTTTPLTVAVDPLCNYDTGDVVNFLVTSGQIGALANMLNRDFLLTKIGTGLYSLTDPITGDNALPAINNWNGTTMTAVMARVLVLTNPYVLAGDAAQVTAAMAGAQLVLYHPNYPTQQISFDSLDTADQRFSQFSAGTWLFQDGPYYQAVFGQVANPSGQSGSVNFTLTGGFGPNQGSPTSADIGRTVRFLSEPLLWQAGTTYSLNQNVLYPAGTGTGPGNYYTSLINSNLANTPDTSPGDWAINPQLANWVYGTITAVSGNQITVTLTSNLFYANPINYWQLGLFGGANGYPTAGTAHEGRLWSLWTNYICASVTFAFAQSYNSMSPTDVYGNVSDSSAITYQLTAGEETSNTNFWAQSGPQGMMVGSSAGEWNVMASANNDPLTPTSIQAHRVTKYGCANVQPAKSGFSVLLVQRFAQRVLELISDVFTGKFAAPNLSLRARHIGRPGFAQIQWAETPNPILWTINKLGGLAGCTYRRLTSFISEEPTFVGWHRHQLAPTTSNATRAVNSISVGPDVSGTYDALTMVATAPANSAVYVVEVSQRMFQEGDPLDGSYFLDDARAPTAIVDTGSGSVVLSGFWPLVGLSVTAFIAGLNCGSYTVDATGSITVPYGSDPDGLFTQAYMLAYPSTGQPGLSTGFAKVITTPPASYSATPATIGEYAASTSSGGTTQVSQDWGNNILWFMDNSAGFLKSFNVTTRAQIASLTLSTISGTIADAMPFGTGAGQDGNFYLYDASSSNSAIFQLPAGTLVPVALFGTSSGSSSPYFAVGTPTVGSAFCVAGGHLFLVGSHSGGNLWVVDITEGRYADYQQASPGPHYTYRTGASGSGAGSVIGVSPSQGANASALTTTVISIGETAKNNYTSYTAWATGTYGVDAIVTNGVQVYQNTGSSPTTQEPPNSPWTVYTIPNQSAIAVNTIGTIAAASIDAGWSAVTCPDFGYDQTDGNIIAFVSGTGNSNTYIIKINSISGGLMWKLATTGTVTNSQGPGFSNITNGIYGFMDQGGNFYGLNTLTGVANLEFTIAGCALDPTATQQLFNGVSNSVSARFNYNSGTTGAPTPLSGTSSTFTDWAEYFPYSAFNPISVAIMAATVPALVGIPYTSIGQRLRPATPQEAGAQNGPPTGKTRRSHMYSAVMNNTPAGPSIGTTAANVLPMIFKSDGGTPYLASQAFSGIKWDVISDAYSFDSMTYWSVTGPYPMILSAVGNFLHTQDR